MNKIEEITGRYNDNNLTYIDREGEHQINIDEFVKTGSDNVLQKLNRTEQVLLKVANAAPEKLKWVNDYAMAKVVKNLFDKVDDLNSSVVAKDTEIERLQNEATASRVSFETEDGIPKEQAEKLLEKIAILEADEQIHMSQLDEVIKERDTALENESVAIKQYEDGKIKYAELEQRFNNSVEAYKTLKAERDDLSDKMVHSSAEMEAEYNELAKMYEELKNNNSSTFTELNDTIRKLNVRLENVGEENNQLTNKIAELQQIRTDLEQECNNYAGEFEKASARCQEIDSRNEELNNEYNKQQELIAQLEEQYNNVCETKLSLEQELENLKQSFGDATGRIRELDSTNVELQNKVNEQEGLINGLQETINAVNEENSELQNNLEEKTKQNALLDAKIRNSEGIEEELHKFDNAVNEFLKTIGWFDDSRKETPQPKHKDTTQHRMGDNQVVNFNMGM